MPTTIGIDLTAVDDVAEAIRTHSERYLHRVYTDAERLECRLADGSPDPARLAARFAAKEATMKALRVEDEPLQWRSIGIRSGRFGAPSLELTGDAELLARRRDISELDVSLTHERSFAAAVVVARTGSSC